MNEEYKVIGGALLGANWTFKEGGQAAKSHGRENGTMLGG